MEKKTLFQVFSEFHLVMKPHLVWETQRYWKKKSIEHSQVKKKKNQQAQSPVKNKNGNVSSGNDDTSGEKLVEHFKETLNRPAPSVPPDTPLPTKASGHQHQLSNQDRNHNSKKTGRKFSL